MAKAKVAFETALEPGTSTVFEWHGQNFWVDKVRGFIAPGFHDRTPPETFSPDTDDVDLIDVYAGEHQMETTGVFTYTWSELAGGFQGQGMWGIPLAKFFNLAVAQPRINPAFGSLFWLLLADELGSGPIWDWSPNIYKRMGSMIYRWRECCELIPGPAEVRTAQIAFAESLYPNAVGADCSVLSDDEWATRCESLLAQNQQLVDDRFFEVVLQGIDEQPGGKFE